MENLGKADVCAALPGVGEERFLVSTEIESASAIWVRGAEGRMTCLTGFGLGSYFRGLGAVTKAAFTRSCTFWMVPVMYNARKIKTIP